MKKLDEIAAQIEQSARPPVHLWKPAVEGKIDIDIDANGHWTHEGDAIQRAPLVRLFASILWFEGGEYFLVTPAEKLAIHVADVPFIVQQLEFLDDCWVATTNTLDTLIVGAEHPVELREYQGQLLPYIRVRYDLWARLNRTAFYEWVSAAMEQNEDGAPLMLSSGDYRFEVAR